MSSTLWPRWSVGANCPVLTLAQYRPTWLHFDANLTIKCPKIYEFHQRHEDMLFGKDDMHYEHGLNVGDSRAPSKVLMVPHDVQMPSLTNNNGRLHVPQCQATDGYL